MRVIRAREHMQLAKHAPAERIFWEHALDRKLDRALGMLVQKLPQRYRFDPADVSGVVVIDLVLELSSGNADLPGIDHDNVIPHVHMRAVISLVLALEPMRDLRRQATQRLAGSIDDIPVATNGA